MQKQRENTVIFIILYVLNIVDVFLLMLFYIKNTLFVDEKIAVWGLGGGGYFWRWDHVGRNLMMMMMTLHD